MKLKLVNRCKHDEKLSNQFVNDKFEGIKFPSAIIFNRHLELLYVIGNITSYIQTPLDYEHLHISQTIRRDICEILEEEISTLLTTEERIYYSELILESDEAEMIQITVLPFFYVNQKMLVALLFQ